LNFSQIQNIFNTFLIPKKPLIFIIILGNFAFFSCKERMAEKDVNYLGPMLEIENMELGYSDSARIMVKMKTALELDLQNKDRVYPKEVKLFFYDKLGVESTTIRSDSGRYINTENHYKLMGNILIVDKLKNQNLTTTELIWAPDKKIIYTHKPVDMVTPSQTIHGMGLQANQDFTQYSLGSSNGVLNVKE
jgi:LPS export ABC transporter protein LptC